MIRVPLAAQIAAVGITVMAIGMWATRPAAVCVMPPEPRRHIDLTRTVDREHLAGDLLESERIARRYALATAPSDAQSLAEQCRTALVDQIATAHELTADQLRTAAEGDQ